MQISAQPLPSFLPLSSSQYRQGMKRMSNRLRMREFKQAGGGRQAGRVALTYTHLGNMDPVVRSQAQLLNDGKYVQTTVPHNTRPHCVTSAFVVPDSDGAAAPVIWAIISRVAFVVLLLPPFLGCGDGETSPRQFLSLPVSLFLSLAEQLSSIRTFSSCISRPKT